MNPEGNLRNVLLTVLVISPLTVFASGQNVLTTIYLQVISIILFIVFLWKVKLNAVGKVLLGITYIVGTWIIYRLIDDIPYDQNMIKINAAVGLVPVFLIAVAYLGLKSKFGKS